MELIPRREPQKITYQQYEENTPEKTEMYQNDIFFDEAERIKMLNLLMTNVGMETMVKNLSRETQRELIDILEEVEMERKCVEMVEQEVLKFGRQIKTDHEYKFDKQNNTLYIFFRVFDTNSIWSIKYTFNKEKDEFIEEQRFQAFACADTLLRLLERK
ncbi:hypothetical protein [Bacillus sp. CGMCC 1.16541]|uniref:hypothetical protein n=1 Tax=Bacillus sp. CGMCC 1.16541 TaxID=2185143 RepID=UPI000D735AEF|nr:hypothetical protein [Bacillus sp. CGMCC 1.16541]